MSMASFLSSDCKMSREKRILDGIWDLLCRVKSFESFKKGELSRSFLSLEFCWGNHLMVLR